MMITTTHRLQLAAALAFGCTALPVLAQDQFSGLQNQTEDMTNLVEAENSKSALCKGYVGQRVVPVTFNALVLTLPKSSAKGEFESTAQYNARVASTKQNGPVKAAVLALPVDRTFVRYDADLGVMLVSAGALNTGEYSEETGAEASAVLATGTLSSKGTPVFVAQSAKVVRTYVAHNLFGAAFRVSEIDRSTQSLHLTNTRLFPFAKRDSSPIMGFEVPLAAARGTKQTLQLALVFQPQAPFLLSYTFVGPEPKATNPNRYTDRSSVIVAEAKCALVLGANNQVLASVDMGK